MCTEFQHKRQIKLTYKGLVYVCCWLAWSPLLSAQSGHILHDLYRLNSVGSALYVAAHPDDENTRLIAYLSNHDKLRTVYLSLTRGDGGQNLIGPELREELGLIRTNELLQARSVDGGKQFFSRANDFGYSKTPEEALSIWNKNEVLADVVWAIRVHKPDVIVNRFNHVHNGRTHGHHTASAMLSHEAFDLAGDSSAFPEQLKYVEPWQPKRLYFNTSWWFYGSREKFKEADKSNMAEVDVGQYYPLLGLSNNEISASSRSMHKCQGFGSATGRGSYYEYLEFLKGEQPSDKNNILSEIDISWNRLNGGDRIGKGISQVIQNFDALDPSKSVPALLKIRKDILELEDLHWRDIKLEELDDIIIRCLGLFARAETNTSTVSPGEKLAWTLEMVNRSPIEVQLQRMQSEHLATDTVLSSILEDNKEIVFEFEHHLENGNSTTPYWLDSPSTLGMYQVPNQQDRGKPTLNIGIPIHLELVIDDQMIPLQRTLSFVRVDPVEGELSDPLRVVPEIFMNFGQETVIFRPNESKTIEVEVHSNAHIDSALITWSAGDDWLIQSDRKLLAISEGESRIISATVTAPAMPESTTMGMSIQTANDTYDQGIVTIEYDHIPSQQIQKKAQTQLVSIDVKAVGTRVGYIEGAGDLVDEALSDIGYSVEKIDLGSISVESLRRYDAIVLGIRSFNTQDELAQKNDVLFDYVEDGGNLIVQYNTRHRLKTEQIAPYPLKLSRKRVTNEYAPIEIIAEDHPVLKFPNKITQKDFDGWVQERGLYYPDEWSEEFTPILSMSDQGEEELQGGLLVAPFGDGYYVYSPLSYFRQVPVGVPGAYRLLANMISLGKKGRP